MKKWICSVCGYKHDGDLPPNECPHCFAPQEDFIEIDQDLRM